MKKGFIRALDVTVSRTVVRLGVPLLIFGVVIVRMKLKGRLGLMLRDPSTWVVLAAAGLLIYGAGLLPLLVERTRRLLGYAPHLLQSRPERAIEGFGPKLVLFGIFWVLPLIAILLYSPMLCIIGIPLIPLVNSYARRSSTKTKAA